MGQSDSPEKSVVHDLPPVLKLPLTLALILQNTQKYLGKPSCPAMQAKVIFVSPFVPPFSEYFYVYFL
jgi:hypothetical protein